MNTTRLVFCAALTFSSLASVRAESSLAWQAEGFVMEEVVVTASAPPVSLPEQIVVTAKAPVHILVEEVVVTAERPAVDVTPGVIVLPSLSGKLDSRRQGMEESVSNVTPEAARTYAARDDALRSGRLF